MEFKNGLSILIKEQMEELDEVQTKYNKSVKSVTPDIKIDWLEEIVMKQMLLMSTLMKAQRNFHDELDDIGSYMYRSDIEKSIAEIREYLNTYKSMNFALAEVLRVERVKLDNKYELEKLNFNRE